MGHLESYMGSLCLFVLLAVAFVLFVSAAVIFVHLAEVIQFHLLIHFLESLLDG